MNAKLKLNAIKKDKSFVHRLFIDLIIVMTINQFSGTFIGLIDTYCSSLYLGNEGLTALGLVSPIAQIITMISMIFGVGGELVFTKLIAKGEKEKANNHLSSNTFFLLILGLILGLILFFASTPLAKGLSIGASSEKVINITSHYLKGLVIGIPFILLDQYLSSIVYLDNDKTRMSLSIVVMFVTNIVLDFIFANYFVDKAFGIGLASTIAFMLSTLVLLTHFFSKKSNFKFRLKSFKFTHIKQSLSVGAVVGVTDIVIAVRLYIINLIMLTVGSMSISKGISGDKIIAASNIEGTASLIFDLGLGGLTETILMLGGVFFEEEDEKSLNELLFDVIKFTLLIGISLSIIYFFTAPYIAGLFSKDLVIVEQATYSMRATSICMIVMSFSTSLLAFLQASKRNLLAHISTSLQSLILPILFISILGFTIGVKGIWIGFPLGFVIYFFLHLIYAFIKNKNIKFNSKVLFFLPKSFGYKENEIYQKNIYKIEDVFSLSSDVLDFCNKFNIDERRKQNASNAIEELANLIVLSGFSKHDNKKKKPYASIKILYKSKNKTLIIRSRDNCNELDLIKKIEEIKKGNDNDIFLNCSLKLLLKISKDIDYSRLLETNNVVITL